MKFGEFYVTILTLVLGDDVVQEKSPQTLIFLRIRPGFYRLPGSVCPHACVYAYI